MENKEELVSSFYLLTEMFDGINNEKRWISYDGDGLHISVYDNPSDLLERKVGEKAKSPLLTLRLVEINGESIEKKPTVCHTREGILKNAVAEQLELEKYLRLLDNIIDLNRKGTNINTEELETRINTLIKNNEF